MLPRLVRRPLAPIALFSLLLAACGGDGTPDTPTSSATDSGSEADATPSPGSGPDATSGAGGTSGDASDARPTDPSGVQPTDPSGVQPTDPSGVQPTDPSGGGSSLPLPTDLPPAGVTLDDTLPCESDIDCPVGFGNCVRTLTFNRVDREGVSSVPLSDLTGPDGPSGVCTLPCTADPAVCNGLALVDGTGAAVRWRCQVVVTGADPYGQDPLDPTGPVEITEMEAGMPFAAICRPPFGLDPALPDDFCGACDAEEPCGDDSTCYDPLAERVLDGEGTGLCASACDGDTPCPVGFRCTAVEGAGELCVPVLDTCTSCRDLDGDGYGTGHCGPANAVTPHDCDDRRADIHYSIDDPLHPFPETCGPVDYNCNGVPDDIEQIGNPAVTTVVDVDGEEVEVLAHCSACGDACGRPVPNGREVCVADENGDGGFACVIACDTVEDPEFGTVPAFANCDGDPLTGCEAAIDDPAFLWWPDADGDGFGDRDAAPVFACAPDEVPENHVNNNLDCDDADAAANPDAEEVCNGRDMNCDGVVDTPELIAGLGEACDTGAPLACGAGVRVCDGDAGLTCAPLPETPEPSGDPVCPGYWPECDPEESRSAAQLRALLGTPCEVEGQVGACSVGEWQCDGAGPPACVQTVQPGPDRPTPPDTDIADPRLRDTSCDGIDGDLAGAIFVTVGGLPDAPGTPDRPTNDLLRAVDLANSRGLDVYIGRGTYPIGEPLVLENGTSLYGGFTDLTWSTRETSPTATTIRHDGTTVSRSAVGVRMANITERTELQRVEIEVREPDAPGSTAVGLRCSRCPGLVLDHVTLTVAGGTAGTGFMPSTEAAASGADGVSSAVPPCFIVGADSGANPLDAPVAPSCPGSPVAGGGGRGGDRASMSTSARAGQRGGPGSPGSLAGGSGGSAGGGNGSSGLGGQSGQAGEAPGGLAMNGGIPMSRSGTAGTRGGGGSGGGGGGGGNRLRWFSGQNIFYSVAGTHGSAGACGGREGSGGQSGGSSYGIVIDRSDGFVANRVTITVGAGGMGGRGQDGGEGGVGGARVDGGDCTSPFGTGTQRSGAGGAGGSGGGGGGGAGGGGGNSIGILRDGTTAFDVSDFTIQFSATEASGGEGGAGGAGGERASGASNSAAGNDGADGENGPAGVSREDLVTDLL
ncbi:MAG: hypothetical protein EA398_02855 [Deltaproteobacteria bacterium]|nr:MAG: hypothetical protein EA398_02855 [Deltaproteobacteria bacterium]